MQVLEVKEMGIVGSIGLESFTSIKTIFKNILYIFLVGPVLCAFIYYHIGDHQKSTKAMLVLIGGIIVDAKYLFLKANAEKVMDVMVNFQTIANKAPSKAFGYYENAEISGRRLTILLLKQMIYSYVINAVVYPVINVFHKVTNGDRDRSQWFQLLPVM